MAEQMWCLFSLFVPDTCSRSNRDESVSLQHKFPTCLQFNIYYFNLQNYYSCQKAKVLFKINIIALKNQKYILKENRLSVKAEASLVRLQLDSANWEGLSLIGYYANGTEGGGFLWSNLPVYVYPVYPNVLFHIRFDQGRKAK